MSKPLRPLLRLTLVMLASMTTGCMDYARDVDRYRQVLDETAARRPVFDSAGPLTLKHALQLANADNEAIALQGESYIQALADKMRQAGTFLPTLSLGPGYSLAHTDGRTESVFSVPASASASGSLSDAATLQAAGRTVDQQAQLLLDTRETILLQVVQAYYDVLRFEKQAAVYENSVKLRAEQVRDQQARLQLGGARPLDLAQSQANLADTRVALTQARTDASNARSALARLMGVAAVTGPLTDAFEVPDQLDTLDAWCAQALAQRQDLIAAARQVDAARMQVDAAIHQYVPSVSINFNYYLHTDPSSAQLWTGGISANIPLFSALQIEADIRAAWSGYRQAGLSESQTRRAVLDDVAQSYQNLHNSRNKIADLQIQLDAAQRAVDLSERAYQLGAETNLDRLIQQDSLLTTELNLVSEQLSAKSNYLALLRASGVLATMLQ